MCTKIYEDNGYGLNLDLLIISHKLHVSYPTWNECKEKNINFRPLISYTRSVFVCLCVITPSCSLATLWTIWIKRNDLASSNNLNLRKSCKCFECARIAWDKNSRERERERALAKLDYMWGDSLLNHMLHTKITWNIHAPNVGLMNHA